MRSPLGLSLYLAIKSWRARALPEPAAVENQRPARPPGPLIWLHIPVETGIRAAVELARRLQDERPGVTILATLPEGVTPPRDTLAQPLPTDTAAFLAHWHPDLIAQVGGGLDAALMVQIHRKKIPLFLIESDISITGALRWIPGMARALLAPCARILSPDEATTRALRRIAGTGLELETTGRLESGTGALTCTEAERAAMTRLLQTRPVWLAASLPAAEADAVIEAHRHALRLAHRLLLIVVPEFPADAISLAEKMTEQQGWTVPLRSTDEDLDEECEVYIADNEEEFGLWYRLAPITYMGGSLSEQGSLRAPFEPAALGSAIIHGPRTGVFAASFAALIEARATREIRTPAELGEAVGDLLSPDRAALLAHNAWSASTSGAEVVDRVARLLLNQLDRAGAR
jgi:3-deoxy-D-manno-octulosonic-acid transferase